MMAQPALKPYVASMTESAPQSFPPTRAVDPQVRPLRWAGKAHSREGRLFLAIRREMVAHVGGQPSATQRALIDRLAWLQVHLARMDARMMQTGEMTEHTGKQYLAWANSVARMLAQLGLASPAPRQLSPEEALSAIRLMHQRQADPDAA